MNLISGKDVSSSDIYIDYYEFLTQDLLKVDTNMTCLFISPY